MYILKPFLVLVFLLLAQSTFSQETKIFLGAGGMYNSFQDTRFSDVQFNKYTFKPEIGFSRISEKGYWTANASIYTFENSFPNYDTISISTLGYNARVSYLRTIKPSFYLGANWDVIDYWRRQTSLLGNNADAYKLSTDVYLTGKYVYKITDHWSAHFSLDYALVSFVNTEPSFTANYQQNIIDNGEVSFIDSDTKSPYKLKNMTAVPFWKMVYVRTQIELNFKRRLSLAYIWDLKSNIDNKGYPVTNANHSLMLRFHFISHTRKNKS